MSYKHKTHQDETNKKGKDVIKPMVQTESKKDKDDNVNEVEEGEQQLILFRIKNTLAEGKKERENVLDDITDLLGGLTGKKLNTQEKSAMKKFIAKNLIDKLSSLKSLQ